jgi:hypothetical protein
MEIEPIPRKQNLSHIVLSMVKCGAGRRSEFQTGTGWVLELNRWVRALRNLGPQSDEKSMDGTNT